MSGRVLKKQIYTFFFSLSSLIKLTLLLIVASTMSCSRQEVSFQFFAGLRDVNDRCMSLVLLLQETENEQHQFAIQKEIAKELKASGQRKRLQVFLSSIVQEESKYKNYFMLMLANEYMERNMPQLASLYFERIVDSDMDLIVGDKSLKLISLNSLIKISNSPENLIKYYSVLIKDFADDINLAYTLFMLARSYERVGEWNVAIQTYQKFLNLKEFDVVVPGISDSFDYAKKIVDYSSSSKNWTVESLSELVGIIQRAVRNQDYNLLDHYRSKVNFFAMTWKEEISEQHSKPDYSVYHLMYGGDIKIAKTVDSFSTPHEAYLRTTGWRYYAKTWYFYLKKINFPADPSIHGRWEWAGIYYGEKL